MGVKQSLMYAFDQLRSVDHIKWGAEIRLTKITGTLDTQVSNLGYFGIVSVNN